MLLYSATNSFKFWVEKFETTTTKKTILVQKNMGTEIILLARKCTIKLHVISFLFE